MGPTSLDRPQGIAITDCNCRNILWIASDGKQEARLGDWGCGHPYNTPHARKGLRALLLDIDQQLAGVAPKFSTQFLSSTRWTMDPFPSREVAKALLETPVVWNFK
eukprot:10686625-Prorocentrum_lima.AAC.1